MLKPSVEAGLRLFLRYAYPPNLRGFCGPADPSLLVSYGEADALDDGAIHLARQFTGPWPYLSVIAASAGILDPFDVRVVEAYWVGNRLLESIDMAVFGNQLDDSFRPRVGTSWEHISDAIEDGSAPHHAFHVFGVYPWVGLLTETGYGQPLEILQGCRIRPGQVVEVLGDRAVVLSQPLTWDGRRLGLGTSTAESVHLGAGGEPFVTGVQPGDWVSLHWDWICDRIDDGRRNALQRHTAQQLRIVNRRVALPRSELIG